MFKKAELFPRLARYGCYGLVLGASVVLSACGGGSSTPAPDLGGAEEQSGGENTPGNAENPGVNPGEQTPTTDPEPQQNDPVALSGSVSSYPDSGNDSVNNSATVLEDETSGSTSLTRADMQPVPALVSLYLLSDVNFQSPVATVKSDNNGGYTIGASDVRSYLLGQNLVADGASDDEVLASFRTLGRLQVRALITRERNGVRRAMAIQSLADPADVDESGVPVPVAIDPIAHRVVKVIVDSIRESVTSLESMGLSPELVDQLIDSVVQEVVVQIDQILEEAADEVIEIPEGLSLDDVIDNQEEELVLDVDTQQLDQLVGVLESRDEGTDDAQLLELESAVGNAKELAISEESTLESSLNSESQGLLSSFESSFTDQLNGSVDQRIDEAREAGTEEALSEVFGERTDGVELEQALATIELQKEKQSRLSIQRFFLSLGLGVIVEENTAGDAAVLAIRLPLAFHLEGDSLPGVAGLGEREIRLFKLGSGELDADSEYTSNPFVELGVLDSEGMPMPPFKYVPALDDVAMQILPGTSLEEAQRAVDEAVARLFDNPLASTADYQLLDRVDVLHELRERLNDSTLVSSRVIDTLVSNRDRQIPLKRIAAAIAGEFEWIQEDVKLTPDGFPIYSGRSGTLAGGASTVDSSELIRALTITLGTTPTSTVRNLTESNSFLAQFAPDAVEFALQRYSFDNQSTLTEALLEIYPEEPEGYRDLITGAFSDEAEPDYVRARDRVARGLTAAIPSRLYGQTLTSDSEVSIRSALFFLDLALRRDYLINPTRGFYTPFEITGADGVGGTRFVPDYANIKRLEPTGEVSVASLMSNLLNITAIDDGELFKQARIELMSSLKDIPELPEHEEHSVDTYIDELGPRSDFVDAYCAVQMFDGSDPDNEQAQRTLKLGVFEVEYNERTGERFKGDRVEAAVSSELMEDATGVYRVYRIAGLPASVEGGYGRDYVLRFTIDSYQNELPELHMYVDGFVPEINLCDTAAPLYIGPDQKFVNLPGVGIVSEQSRFQSSQDASETQFEWIDLSNFEEPGAPLYITDDEEFDGFGAGDFRLESSDEVYRLVGPADSGVGFARLFGAYIDGELQLSLESGDAMQPVFGLQSVVGANARDVIKAVAEGEALLSESLAIAQVNPVVGEGSDERDTTLSIMADEAQKADFELQALYLFRDRDGRYWVLELRHFESYVEFDDVKRAYIDLGIASVNNIGLVDVPNVNYDAALPETGVDIDTPRIEYHNMFYGDWLVLEKPTDYQGSELLPPEVLAFSDSDEYTQLRQAIDGVFIRYSGQHFSENVRSIEDIETVFGTSPNFSSVPARLDAGRPGISFIKLSFDKSEKRYVMDPLPQDAAPFVEQLKHNDLVAVFNDRSEDDGPAFLIRVIIDSPNASASGFMGMEVLRYDNLSDNLDEFDERQVVCFFEDRGNCPEAFPALFSTLDAVNTIGIVYDSDVDGVPAIFDPNDRDPNVPGGFNSGDVSQVYDGIDGFDDLVIESVAGIDDDGVVLRALIARTRNSHPGEIDTIELQSDLFGVDSQTQTILSCEPSMIDDFGVYIDVRCEPHAVADDVEIEIFQQSQDGVSLLMLTTLDQLAEIGDFVEFSYQINYRSPLDFDGSALTCGDELCPGRPASSGVISVPVGRDIPVHDQVSVQVDGELPSELRGMRELNVDREIRVSAAALPGAVDYELAVYCPSSSQSEGVTAQTEYQPEERISFFAPARDDSGLQLPPDFKLNIDWLAGRECRISLRSFIETEAGDNAGISLFVQDDVVLTGSYSDSVFIDNETSFKVGDSVCVENNNQLSVDNCEVADSLFTVQSLDTLSDGRGQISLALGDVVSNAHAESYSWPLFSSRLEANAQIAFDGISQGQTLSCGEISGIAESFSSCANPSENMETLFTVSDDGAEMRVMVPGILLEGPVNQNGNISLNEPGYYQLIRAPDSADVSADTEASTDTDGDIFADASADIGLTGVEVEFPGGEVIRRYEVLMGIMIEAYEDDAGEQEAYVRFEGMGQSDYFDMGSADRMLSVSAPGYINIQSTGGYEVSMDVRTIIDEQMKLSFYINQLMQVAGGHDLNGDGITDVDVWSEAGLWYFSFASTVDDVRDAGSPDGQLTPLDASGSRVLSYPADVGFAEMSVRVAEKEYLLLANFNADGTGGLEIIDHYPVDEQMVELPFDGKDFENYFPIELSVASPFAREQVEQIADEGRIEMDATDAASTGTADEVFFPDSFQSAVSMTNGIQADAERIDGILRGRFSMDRFFLADNLRGSSIDAGCFGPQMYYQNHPDGVDAEPTIDFATGATNAYATLPTGDLGIWSEYDQETGHACAAAQLNSQLATARSRTFTGLVALAGVVRRLTPEQQDNVMQGMEVSVVDRMNALQLPNVIFEQAQVSMQADSGEWNYTVTLYNGTEEPLRTSVEMVFNPGEDTDRWDYSGVMTFRVEDRADGYECQDGAIEHLSSTAFRRVTEQRLDTEYRYAMACGHGGTNGFDSQNMVDPTYSALVADDGWKNNLAILVANTNPYNGSGRYAYSWQAGMTDSHSRVLNVTLNDVEPIEGEAWYGYGQNLARNADEAGEINGFICNWAGPGNNRAVIEKAQRQSIVYDYSTDRFIVSEGGSSIIYAPTVECTYDSDSGGSFLYDRNLDGALSDESAETVDVGPGEQLPFDLAPPAFSDFDGLDIEEVILRRGFVKPESPLMVR